MVAVAGVTAMEIRTGAVTVKAEDPEIVPEVAVMVVAPWPTLVASPLAFTLATLLELDVHVTELVRVFVVPSV